MITPPWNSVGSLYPGNQDNKIKQRRIHYGYIKSQKKGQMAVVKNALKGLHKVFPPELCIERVYSESVCNTNRRTNLQHKGDH